MPYDNLNDFVEYLRAIQVKDDNDLFIGITGKKGAGKSSLSINIAKIYVKKYFGEKHFNLNKYLAYNNNDLLEKMYTLPKYSPLIGDEAVRFAWSRDWNKSENKELARLSAQIRTKKFIFFMNIPKLSWIDSVYREGMLDIWIWIHSTFSEKGKECHALMFEPDDNQGEGDSWHLNLLRKYSKSKKSRIGRFTDIGRLYRIVSKHPCYVDMFKFPKVEQELYDRYLAIRDEKAFEKADQYVNQKDTSKIMVYNLKHKWSQLVEEVQQGRFGNPSYKMIADILMKDPRTKDIIVEKTTISKWYNEVKEKTPIEIQQVIEDDAKPEEIKQEVKEEVKEDEKQHTENNR